MGRQTLWLAPIVLTHVLVLVVPTWTRVARYCVHYFDLGIYAQALYALSPRTPNPLLAARDLRIFNDHFDPILFLATPFTWVVAQPYGPLLAEASSYLLALAAMVWLHQRGRLDVRGLCLAAALLLLGSGTVSAVLYPAHTSVWAVAPMAWCAALLIEGRRRAAILCFALLFACREEMPFVGVAAGVVFLFRDERRLGSWVLGLALGWALVAMVLRPLWIGPTHDYVGRLFQGLRETPAAAIAERVDSLPALALVAFMLLTFAPLCGWAAKHRIGPVWPLAVGLVPLLAIRFLGKSWTHHYLGPVVGLAVAASLGILVKRSPPRWVLAWTAPFLLFPIILLAPSQLRLYLDADVFPRACAGSPARLNRIEAALERMRTEPPGRKLLGGNLLVHAPPGDDTFFPGGPHPEGATYDVVLVEKPPSGDPFPLTHARSAELIDQWRRSATWILIDDPFLFMARGRFVNDR